MHKRNLFSLRRYWKMVSIALALAVAIGVSIVVTAGASPQSRRTVARTLTGLPVPINANVPLVADDRQAIHQTEQSQTPISVGAVQRLRVGAQVQFYRLTNTAGSANCFAVGPLSLMHNFTLGQIRCDPSFPSSNMPILDFTNWYQASASSAAVITRSIGITADGVASVAFEEPDGTLIDTTPVSNDLFEFTKLPTVPVTAIVALDGSGSVIGSRQI